MINKLKKITDKVYRGSGPSPQDVKWLHDNLGIKKIVSLDQEAGERIDNMCKLLKIKHIMLPINSDKKSLLTFLHHDLKKLLLDGGPTYIHCLHGKDRTGLAAALFKCKYLHMDPEDAIKEAKSLGFGVGVPPEVTAMYEKIIRSCKPISKDTNKADIVSNEREYVSDTRDSFLDETHQGSFSPYLTQTKQNPMDAVYNFIDEQSPTRQNYNRPIIEKDLKEQVPQVGVFNNDAGIQGAGPTENYSGFFYD